VGRTGRTVVSPPPGDGVVGRGGQRLAGQRDLEPLESAAQVPDQVFQIPRRAPGGTGEVPFGQPGQRGGDGGALLMEGDQRVQAGQAFRVEGSLHQPSILWRSRSCRAITSFWISLVPSPINRNGASRYSRSIVYSVL